jgi:hypothetical protein
MYSHSLALCFVLFLTSNAGTGQMAKRGDSVAAFKPIVTKLIQDIQERLIFVAQTFIYDNIANFVPQPQDLDYPNKLHNGEFFIRHYFSVIETEKEKKCEVDAIRLFLFLFFLHSYPHFFCYFM